MQGLPDRVRAKYAWFSPHFALEARPVPDLVRRHPQSGSECLKSTFVPSSRKLPRTMRPNTVCGAGTLGCWRAVEGPNDLAVLALLARRHNVGHIVGDDPVEPIPARSCSGEEPCADLAVDRLIPRRSQPWKQHSTRL